MSERASLICGEHNWTTNSDVLLGGDGRCPRCRIAELERELAEVSGRLSLKPEAREVVEAEYKAKVWLAEQRAERLRRALMGYVEHGGMHYACAKDFDSDDECDCRYKRLNDAAQAALEDER